jgi:hypothetical protein
MIPALVSLALHSVAIALSRNLGSTPTRDLAELAGVSGFRDPRAL